MKLITQPGEGIGYVTATNLPYTLANSFIKDIRFFERNRIQVKYSLDGGMVKIEPVRGRWPSDRDYWTHDNGRWPVLVEPGSEEHFDKGLFEL